MVKGEEEETKKQRYLIFVVAVTSVHFFYKIRTLSVSLCPCDQP